MRAVSRSVIIAASFSSSSSSLRVTSVAGRDGHPVPPWVFGNDSSILLSGPCPNRLSIPFLACPESDFDTFCPERPLMTGDSTALARHLTAHCNEVSPNFRQNALLRVRHNLIGRWRARENRCGKRGHFGPYFRNSSKRLLLLIHHRAMIFSAPNSDQNMPDCLQRPPITVLKPAFTTPETESNCPACPIAWEKLTICTLSSKHRLPMFAKAVATSQTSALTELPGPGPG